MKTLSRCHETFEVVSSRHVSPTQAMVDKHRVLIEQAAAKDVQILCFQKLFYDPRFPAEHGQDKSLVANMDLDMITDVRNVWQFYRDRLPELYGSLVAP